jgi:hypothetical protein
MLAARGDPTARCASAYTHHGPRIVLALELAGLRAAKVALPLEVIDERWGVTPYEPIAGAGLKRALHEAGQIAIRDGMRLARAKDLTPALGDGAEFRG